MAESVVGRLKRRVEFLKVAGSGRKCVTPGLILQVRRHPPGEPPGSGPTDMRVGFTVSRKVGNAVERNRARRRLKAAASGVLAGGAASGHDYVVIGRRATLTRPFPALAADLLAALGRLGVCRGAGGDHEAATAKRSRDHESG